MHGNDDGNDEEVAAEGVGDGDGVGDGVVVDGGGMIVTAAAAA